MVKKRDRISQSTRKIRARMFLVWMISLLIPIIILILYNFMIYGPKTFKFLTNPEFFNREIWQMEKYNPYEYAGKYFNNLILEDPDSVLDVKNHDIILDEDSIERFEMIILIRRNDKIISVNDLTTQAGQEVIQKMKSLTADVFPKFKGGEETNNEELFLKSGYVMFRQTDFYFSNGDEGSILFLRKFANIPGKILQVLMRNMLVIIAGIAIIQTYFSYKMAKHITRPIDDMIKATNEVRDGNFGYRMQIRTRGPLNELILVLNDMIIDLDAGRKYREEMEETRKEFLASLSHDLKTPMTSIKIHTDAIRDGIANTPEKMERYLGNINRKVRDMDKMLEELKTFSELENSVGNYFFQKVGVRAVVEDIVDELRYDISDDKVEIRYSDELLTCDTVEIDVEKMKRVVVNIITNSIKYCEKKPLLIDISMKNIKKGDVDFVCMTIKDNGIGIPSEKIGRIFDKFYRVDEARNQEKPGSGLGLAIAKSIVEEHGGEIQAKSEYGDGLEILIKLQCV